MRVPQTKKRTAVKGTRHSEEQIIAMLKPGEAGLATADLCRQHGISEQTYYRRKAKYGGMESGDALDRRQSMYSPHKHGYQVVCPKSSTYPGVSPASIQRFGVAAFTVPDDVVPTSIMAFGSPGAQTKSRRTTESPAGRCGTVTSRWFPSIAREVGKLLATSKYADVIMPALIVKDKAAPALPIISAVAGGIRSP
jgi:Transposase